MKNDGDIPPPLSILSVVKEPVKRPPNRDYSFFLEILPRRESYRWMLLRYSLNKPLPASGVFQNAGSNPGLGAEEFWAGSSGEKVVVLYFYNADAFRAIRLPNDGTVTFKPLILSSSSDVAELEVWEVESLKVNGETPLEEWLPFDPSSQATDKPINARVEANRRAISFEANLNVDTNSADTYRPKGEVKTIVASGTRKWVIPFIARSSEETSGK